MPSVTFTNTYSVSYWGSVTASVRVTFSESYNQNTNQTTLTLTGLEFKKNGSATIGDIPVYGVLSVNGTTVCTIDNSGSGKKSSVNMDGDGWCSASLTNVTKTPVVVTHNADGTKSVSVSVAPGTNSRFCAQYSWYHQTGTDPSTGHAIYRTTYVPFGVTSSSATMALTTRPRISSVSASNANFGSAVTITINRYNSDFTHTIKASCAGRTETVMTKGTTYPTVTWTPSVANFAPLITTAMSATATITCETYNGNTLIGTSTTTCTLTFTSASVKPSVSIATADPTGLLSTYGKYVVGKSKVKVTLTNTLKYGATVTAIAITANGASYNSSPATTDFIASTSNTSVTAKITDSRGQTATASATIQIYDYTAPKINSASVYRCDSGGTANNAGAYFRVAYNVAITALGNHNTKTLTVKYKKRSASSYSSSSITMSSYSQSGNSSAIAADVNSTYDVQLVLADAFGSATVTMSLPTAETRMNFGAGQNGGVAIGKVSEYNKTFEVAQSWIVRAGDVRIEKGSGDVYCYAKRTDTSVQAKMGVGSGGSNHGIYSDGYYDGSAFHSDAKWMIYRNGSGNVIVNGTSTDDFNLQQGTNIPNNSDLDNYTTPGCYYVLSSTEAATISHGPITDTGYKLVVMIGSISDRRHQIAFRQSSTSVYMRYRDNSSWSAWELVNTVTDRGSSGNWRWVKRNDGTCDLYYQEAGHTADFSTAKGSIYVQSSQQALTYPFTVYRGTASVAFYYNSNAYITWATQVAAFQSQLYYRLACCSSISSIQGTFTAHIAGYWQNPG